MKILVTGGTGFVGVNLQNYWSNLSPDIIPITASRSLQDSQTEHGSINYNDISAGWLDKNHIYGIVHLAGIAHDLSGKFKTEDYFKVNYGLTATIYDEFLKSNSCKKFIFISSVKAITDHANEILTEDYLPNPKSAYGKSKLKAENYLKAQQERKDQKTFILKPAMVYGAGNKGNLNLLYKLVKNGVPYPLGAYQNQRSFLSVNNLSFIITQLLTGHYKSGDYNCADDDDLSTVELVKIIAQAINKPARIIRINKWIMDSIASVGDFIKLPFNKSTLNKLTENYVVSNSKILKELNINTLPYSSKEELTKTILSFESN